MKTKIILLVGFLITLSFCGPRKELITTTPDLPESPKRIYPFILKRNISYQSLTVKNIKIDFSTPNNDSRLYGSLRMIKDSAVLISLRSPLGIEISRLLYTQDSVKMLDRRNKKAYFTNYARLSEIAPLDFNFKMLQTIFSGNIPENYRKTRMPEPQSIRDTLQNEIYLGTYNAPKGMDYMNFYGWVYKDLARPSYIVFYKDEKNKKYTVKYLKYQEAASHNFPKEVKIFFDQYNQTHKLNLQLNGISLGEYKNIHIDVPSSYKTIHH